MKATIKDYVNACFTGLWIQTSEPDEAERDIAAVAKDEEWNCLRWDVADGWAPHGEAPKDPGNPQVPLKVLRQAAPAGTDGTTIMVLHNYHRFLNNPVVVQDLFNTVIRGKLNRAFAVILSPLVTIPPELEKVFVVINHDLPDKDTLNHLAADLHENAKPTPQVIEAASGLTRYEAEGAFSLSMARHGALCPEEVWELKESMLKKSGLVSMHRGKEKFDDLGGLEGLKNFCLRAMKTIKKGAKAEEVAKPIRPKGLLLLGVPGTGKSAFAKALGNETGRPTLILDVGSLYGSLVGQTEERIRQALKIADAMAPCVLFVDEIEKALSGVGGEGDSGVSTRLFGTILTWLNDHTSDVFFVGTCNDVSKLPPEFSRAERFDGIFFIDLPGEDERDRIWRMYVDQFGIDYAEDHQAWDPINDVNWTGAEIKACCRLAALLGVMLTEAQKHIVPVATTAAAKVEGLREWASGRCLSATTGGIFNHNHHQPAPKGRRNIKEKSSA